MVAFSKLILVLVMFQWRTHKKIVFPSLIFFYLLWRLIRKRYLRWPIPPPGASIFITGTDAGIGRTTALHLNALGYHVFCGVLNEDNGSAIKLAAMYPQRITSVKCDVTNLNQVRKAAALISTLTNNKLWGLVNNAGLAASDGPVEFLPQERVEKTINVNLWGVWNVTRAFLPMIRSNKGRIVNIASVNGFICWPGNSAYCISKFGVEALTDCLRLDIYPLGCMVSVIEPGGIKTDIWKYVPKMMTDCWNEMGPNCWQVYGKKDCIESVKVIDKMKKDLSSPMVVAQAIEHALCSHYPKLRYRVGSSATLLGALKELLPDRVVHNIMSREYYKTQRYIPWNPSPKK